MSRALRRRNKLNLFREAHKLGSFDEFPMLLEDVDPQVHASRNEVDQPFYLVCEKDTVVAQISGAARVVFTEGGVRYFDLAPGDFVYVPAGAPHRVLTREAGLQLRYKARQPGSEAVVWYCEQCGAQLDRMVWQSTSMLSQAAYQQACERHNRDEERRRCSRCGFSHPVLDLEPFRWSAVAQAIADADEDL